MECGIWNTDSAFRNPGSRLWNTDFVFPIPHSVFRNTEYVFRIPEYRIQNTEYRLRIPEYGIWNTEYGFRSLEYGKRLTDVVFRIPCSVFLGYLIVVIIWLYVVWRKYYCLWPGLPHLYNRMAARRVARVLLPLTWVTSSL